MDAARPRDVGQPPDHAPRAPLRPVAAPRHAPRHRRRHDADGGAAGGGVEGRRAKRIRARKPCQDTCINLIRCGLLIARSSIKFFKLFSLVSNSEGESVPRKRSNRNQSRNVFTTSLSQYSATSRILPAET